MQLKLDIRRTLTARSDRVKCVDLHPTEPWMLVSLYNGKIHVWNHQNQQLIKTFEVCSSPVRAGKFIARKNWIITGSDDYRITVFNYNTLERQHVVDAHMDYIRCLAVHPTLPIVLSGSDDMTIKMWNWDKNWACQKVFDGHSHYVIQIVFNPKDNNTFASASWDKTIKIWQLASSNFTFLTFLTNCVSIPNFTLEGHMKAINCLDYTHAGEKPYLISGADDRLVKIWDYQNRSCVQSLDGHTAVAFHPRLPIIITGFSVMCKQSKGYQILFEIKLIEHRRHEELPVDFFWIVCWGEMGIIREKQRENGKEDPTFSMDEGGKIVWIKHSEMEMINLKQLAIKDIKDGERLNLSVKKSVKLTGTNSCLVFPNIGNTTLAHNSNGRYVAVCGEGEYNIYTAMALRNKAYGSALEFVWGIEPEDFAIRESATTVKPELGADGIYGGTLLGVRSANHLTFYAWDTLELVRRIEIQPKGVFWGGNGEMVAITTEESFYVLKYNASVVAEASEEGRAEDGYEDAFEVMGEVAENVKTATWVGYCFFYSNSLNRLNYYVGGEIVTISHLDRPHYILGYIPRDNRIYLCDKRGVYSMINIQFYHIINTSLDALHFAWANPDHGFDLALQLSKLDLAVELAERIGGDQKWQHLHLAPTPAHFLPIQISYTFFPLLPRCCPTAHEKQGFVSDALHFAWANPDHGFDLALQLSKLDLAVELAERIGGDQKWQHQNGRWDMAEKCYEATQDFGALLILSSSSGNLDKVSKLAEVAHRARKFNVAFTAYLLTQQNLKALNILVETNKLPDAAFFARTYLPSEVPRVTQLWKAEQQKTNAKVAQGIADPSEYPNLFPSFEESLRGQKYLEQSEKIVPASHYSTRTSNSQRNVFEELSKACTSGSNLEETRENNANDGTYFAHFSGDLSKEKVTQLWKAEQQKTNAKMAQGIADPSEYPNLFPSFEESLRIQAKEKELETMSSDSKKKEKKIRDLTCELKEVKDMLNKAKWEAQTVREDNVSSMAEEENEV
ncbi:hypothetical protein QYM36_016841 [Artemia franciscana]|uniref:Coatomer subunit beta' n=1 Tax=Artemia franciscana TaxID=6661 RepID=A0AA88KWB0_ARTSF|nr:hypothetical protein QYM36_016841 [Artemia franciscana]